MFALVSAQLTFVYISLFIFSLQVIAFICGCIVILLMVLSLASTNWLTSDKFRQGLWNYCVEEDAPRPLPFNIDPTPGCFPGRDVGYIKLAGSLCVLTLIADLIATVITGFGLCSKEPGQKYTLYRLALYIMLAAFASLLMALIIYPAMFAAEIEQSNRQVWEYGWAYGVGWGAGIFLFGGIVLLACDKESEEIFYKERTIVHNVSGGIVEVKA